MWIIQKKVAGVGEVWYNNDIWFLLGGNVRCFYYGNRLPIVLFVG